MYVLMAWGVLRAGAWQEFEQHYVDKTKPMTQGMKGLQERQLWLGTSGNDEVVAWSVWDSLGDLRAYEFSEARRDLAQEVEQYYQPWAYPRGEFWVKHFEVVSTYKA
jgi:heme-degrading monooxygenase HmoA